MNEEYRRYSLFFKFIKKFSSTGFQGIDRHDPLVLDLEEMMDYNNQYLSVFDMLHMKTLFVSQGSLRFLGIKPEELTLFILRKQSIPMTLKGMSWDYFNCLK